MDFMQNSLSNIIGKKIYYHRSLDENVTKFKRKCEELNIQKEDVESQMKVELQYGKRLKKQVQFWLANVQRINDEKQNIENKVEEVRYFERSRLGELIAEKIQEVEELHLKGSFAGGLVVDAPPQKGAILPTTKLAGETTAMRKMKEIWACLINNDDFRKIGIYGMGGSGKTTLMKHINNDISEKANMFDNVIWVTVSRALSVKKLQNEIARALNEDISKYKDATRRAAKVFDILTQKRRYVLILDDIWEAFSLENVGIPEPTVDNGCKIVLTTRSSDVCRRMGCKSIKMELLSEVEAWNLFSDNVGQEVLLTPGVQAIAELVAKECACLPLAIVTIAGSMKGIVDKCEWNNALEELRESTKGLNEMGKVLMRLKYSYSRLKDEMLQHCLLYCALFPEDYAVERRELIEFLIVEKIIDGLKSTEAEFHKGHSILNRLENACLLESCTNHAKQKCVKMHDLIRDMALQIMGRRCMVKAGVRLTDLPEEEQWTEDLERVSLMENNIREICSGVSPICSKLSTLLLSANWGLAKIPSSFFVHVSGLRVLDLSRTGIYELPNSMSELENLTALLLGGCRGLKYVPSLAKLRSLRKLDLSNTMVEEVPSGLEKCVNLRHLNLMAKDLKMLPVGILPELSHLRCLKVWWKSNTLKVKGDEVACLRRLETLVVQFYDVNDFNIYVRSLQGGGPSIYLLRVGPGIYLEEFEEGARKCIISGVGDFSLMLPSDVKQLEITECNYMSSLCNVLFSLSSSSSQCLEMALPPLSKLSCLKELFISGCPNIKKLFAPEFFPHLQNVVVIDVRSCEGLEEIIAAKEGQNLEEIIATGTLSHLKELYVSNCPNINKMFTPGFFLYLQNLEVIDVRNCEKLEEIIAAKEGGEEASLPPPCSLSGLKELCIIGCQNIKKLFPPGFLLHLQNLEAIKVSYCEGLEEIMEAKGGESRDHSIINNSGTMTTITLPKLRNLHLDGLPELKTIVCSRGIVACHSIQKITVRWCPKLKRLPLSLPMLNGRPSPPPTLQRITIDNRQWWEMLEWDHPTTKDVLHSFLVTKAITMVKCLGNGRYAL